MSDHEELHEAREQDADRLEAASESLGDDIEAAKEARDRAAADELIATEAPEQPDPSGPESDDPAKG